MAWLIYLACASFDKFMEPLKLYFIIYVSDCPERVFCIKRIVLNVHLVNEILSKGFCNWRQNRKSKTLESLRTLRSKILFLSLLPLELPLLVVHIICVRNEQWRI